MVFFVAFNFLEASLPSLVSRTVPPDAKGAAAGLFSSVQFLGTFVGAAAGGWLSQHWGAGAVFAFCGIITLGWLAAAAGMSVPVLKTLPFPPVDPELADGLVRQLLALPGVREARILSSGDVAQLKVDAGRFDEGHALRLINREVPEWLPSTK
jgi:MFS family permease